MKRLLAPTVTLFTAACLLSACDPEPAHTPNKPGVRPPNKPMTDNPAPTDAPTEPRSDRPPSGDPTSNPQPMTHTNPPPTTPPAQGNFEYGKNVPGRPGFVTSPYAPYQGYVDVRGYPPGTEVKDPYTGKVFLVPAP